MRTRSPRMVDAAAWVHRRAGVCARALVFVCVSVCLCAACVGFVRFSTVLHASFARLRDACGIEPLRTPSGARSTERPCAVQGSGCSRTLTHGVRTLTCCAAPSLIPHTRALARTRTNVRGRARHIGSAAPGRPSQLKRRLWTAPLAHASTTRRARAADAFGARTRQGRVAAEGRRLQLLRDRRGGEVLE